MMEVRKIFVDENAAWDQLVRLSPQGNVFLLHEFQTAWCETDPSLYLVRLGCYDEHGQLVGGQAIFYNKVLGMRIPATLNIFYSNTPILPLAVQNSSQQRHAVLSALARNSGKYFPFLKVEFHPTLNDARPYLTEGWRVCPEYTYIWDISNPNAIIMNIQYRKRKYVRKAREQFLFASETGETIFTDFLRLYRETMQKFGWRPEENWGNILRKRVEWMQTKGIVRFHTCRAQSGELISVVVSILSRINQTAYSMFIGYDHSTASKEFSPALDWYIAQDLSPEFSYVDFCDAPQPNLYAYKDSLGTRSTQYWIVETPNAHRWRNFFNTLRKIKNAVTKYIPRIPMIRRIFL